MLFHWWSLNKFTDKIEPVELWIWLYYNVGDSDVNLGANHETFLHSFEGR